MDYIIVFGAIFLFAIMFCLISEHSRRKKLTCKECGTVYGDDDIEYEEVSQDVQRTNTSRREYSYVEFHFVCPKCGKEKRFKKKFLTYSYVLSQNGTPSEKHYDLQHSVNNFLDTKFREKLERKQAKKAAKAEAERVATQAIEQAKAQLEKQVEKTENTENQKDTKN